MHYCLEDFGIIRVIMRQNLYGKQTYTNHKGMLGEVWVASLMKI